VRCSSDFLPERLGSLAESLASLAMLTRLPWPPWPHVSPVFHRQNPTFGQMDAKGNMISSIFINFIIFPTFHHGKHERRAAEMLLRWPAESLQKTSAKQK